MAKLARAIIEMMAAYSHESSAQESPGAKTAVASDELNLNEIRVLLALKSADAQPSKSSFQTFAGLSAATGLDQKAVRRSVRALAQKGMAKFSKGGIWSDDQTFPIGAGYAITELGRKQDAVLPGGEPGSDRYSRG